MRCASALVGGEVREDYAFVVRDGTIAASGNFTDVSAKAADLGEAIFFITRSAGEFQDSVNGHSHAYQILLRGWADDWTFADWRSNALYKIIPELQRRWRRLLGIRRRIFGNAFRGHNDGRRSSSISTAQATLFGPKQLFAPPLIPAYA